jgi:hypothetical protein
MPPFRRTPDVEPMTQAWHFVGKTLRDGRPIPADGVTLKHEGPVVLCESGLHASARIFDALAYAPGTTVCRVELSGTIFENEDKLAASERTIRWRMDATDVLNAFARRCALDVIHLWDAPEVVRTYLETGDGKLRAAACAAACAAARAAHSAAAHVATYTNISSSDATTRATTAYVGYNTWLGEMVLAAKKQVDPCAA